MSLQAQLSHSLFTILFILHSAKNAIYWSAQLQKASMQSFFSMFRHDHIYIHGLRNIDEVPFTECYRSMVTKDQI
jgi:hypothetical protein